MSQRGRAVWVALLMATLVWPAQAVRLQYKGKAGDRYVYGIGTAMHSSMQMGGQTQSVPVKMTMRLVIEVLKADGASLQLRYRTEKPAMEVNGQPMPFPMGQGGEVPAFLVTMQRNGKVTKVEQEGEDKANPAVPRGLQPNLSDSMNQAFLFFPDKDIKPGETWTSKGAIPTPMGGTIEISNKSTFVGIETVDGVRCAKIKTEFSIPLSLSLANAPNQPGAGSMKGAVTGTSVSYFDLEAGQLHKSEMEGQSQVSMTGPAPGQTGGGQVSVKMASNIRSNLKRMKQ